MSIFQELCEEFLSSAVSAFADSLFPQDESAGIDRLCNELGWAVDERTRDGVALYFNDPVARIRKVMVTEGTKLMLLSTVSASAIPASRVPAEVLGYLLLRNAQMPTCSWQASATDSGGNVSFALTYCALVAGLDAATFKIICETMVKEAHEFDVKLKAAGLL